jgi:hypothetical protein
MIYAILDGGQELGALIASTVNFTSFGRHLQQRNTKNPQTVYYGGHSNARGNGKPSPSIPHQTATDRKQKAVKRSFPSCFMLCRLHKV